MKNAGKDQLSAGQGRNCAENSTRPLKKENTRIFKNLLLKASDFWFVLAASEPKQRHQYKLKLPFWGVLIWGCRANWYRSPPQAEGVPGFETTV